MKYFDEYATQAENFKQYRLLAMKHHPDIKGGSTKIMADITAEWHLAKKKYESGEFPRKKQPAQHSDPFNVFGGKVYPAPPPSPLPIIKKRYKGKTYKGTLEEVYMGIFCDHGPLDAIQFLVEQQIVSAAESISIEDIFKNMFK